MLEAVTFDWWFTIVDMPVPQKEYTPWAKDFRVRGMHDVLREAGHDVPLERLSEAYDLLSRHLEDVWAKDMDLSGEEQIAVFMQYAGLQRVNEPDMIRRLAEPFTGALLQRPPVLNDGVAACLRDLMNDGRKIGIISNTGRTWGRALREIQKGLGISDYFDVLTFSDEIGLRKPHPAIFTKTLDKLQLPPESVLHIGDDVLADVRGAKRVGMKAVWYNNGTWPNAKTDEANAEIHHFAELPDIVRRL